MGASHLSFSETAFHVGSFAQSNLSWKKENMKETDWELYNTNPGGKL